MTVFVITYDLVDADSYDYTVLIDQLETMQGDHIQESVWLVDWKGTESELMSHLAPFFSVDDSIFVTEMKNWLYHGGKNKINVRVTPRKITTFSVSWGSKLMPVDQY